MVMHCFGSSTQIWSGAHGLAAGAGVDLLATILRARRGEALFRLIDATLIGCTRFGGAGGRSRTLAGVDALIVLAHLARGAGPARAAALAAGADAARGAVQRAGRERWRRERLALVRLARLAGAAHRGRIGAAARDGLFAAELRARRGDALFGLVDAILVGGTRTLVTRLRRLRTSGRVDALVHFADLTLGAERSRTAALAAGAQTGRRAVQHAGGQLRGREHLARVVLTRVAAAAERRRVGAAARGFGARGRRQLKQYEKRNGE